ncbi:LxmA leader domain family RiPP [Nocardioides zeae]|uniref:LxmA leader domain family RiPP n=1 Tax=Nocardioides imazamoxiresistens TaxID=3231893 RepID=A0ABU3PW96_9ACTN|nr:LxmA leader domain family RiPP [Nocardioides zeae]MDT9593112.1 LxmA leader domain family RiPP [Nocardioides zeae]
MSTQDLVAGYAAYTDAAELGPVDDAAAVTPTVTSSAPCAAGLAASVAFTVDAAC